MNEQPRNIQLMPIQTEPDEELSFRTIFLIIKRKLWVILSALFIILLLALLYISRAQKQYEAKAIVKVPPSSGNTLSSGISSIFSFGQSSDIYTEIELIKSRQLAENVISELEIGKKPEFAMMSRNQLLLVFQKIFNVNRIQQTNLLEIKAYANSPDDAAKTANAIAQEYIRISERASKKVWDDLISQMEKKREEIKKELEDSRQLLRQYESREGIDTAFGSLLLTGETSGPMTKPENYQTIANLKSSIMQLEMRLEALRIDLPEANPQIISLRDQIANTKQKLREEENRLVEIYNKQFGLSDLAARVVFNQQVYTTLVTKHEDLKAQFIVQYKTPELIESAIEPVFPSSPRKMVILAAAIFFGGVLGLALAFISEFMGKKINASDYIERNFDIQILGRIPKLRGKSRKQNILVNGNISNNSWIGELYLDSHRAIRTELISQLGRLPESNERGKVIVVTSPTQKEGKSVIAANLAISLAETMSKVVLIDLNQRHPMQKEMFDLESDTGLINLLSGETLLGNSIAKTDIGNLHLLSIGKSDNGYNLGGLLVSENMSKLFNELREQFDYIVIDSTPVTLATDSIAVGVKSDGLVLVARMGLTQKNELEKAKQIIHDSDINLLGIILNETSPDKRYRKYYN